MIELINLERLNDIFTGVGTRKLAIIGVVGNHSNGGSTLMNFAQHYLTCKVRISFLGILRFMLERYRKNVKCQNWARKRRLEKGQ